MATVSGRWLAGTRYRDIIGTDDPAGAPPHGDFVNAGPGNDYLIGDIGADVFGFSPGDGYDYIDAFTPGEDKLQFGGGLTAASLRIETETHNGVAGLSIYYQGPNGTNAVFVAGVSALQPGDIEFGDLLGTYFDPPPRDFDNNFRSDVLLQGRDGAVAQWLLGGTGVIGASVIGNPGAGWRVVGTGDFDANWYEDVLLQNQDGSLAAWYMHTTAIEAGVTLPNPGAQWHAVGIGHLDDDAGADILFRHDDGHIGAWLMGGVDRPPGTIAAVAVIADPGAAWNIVGIGDLNGDYKSDILVQNKDGTLGQWQMDGTTVVGATVLGTLPAGGSVVGTGDFDGNDRDEILLRQADGALTIWTTNNGAVVSATDIGNPGVGWKAVGIGDYNGDGKADILLQQAEGTVSEWLLNGTTLAGTATVASPGADWQVV